MKDEKNMQSFEDSLDRLEKITEELGKENIGLDDALKLYEEGIGLVRKCNAKLEDAERTIKILQTDSDGVISEKNFEI